MNIAYAASESLDTFLTNVDKLIVNPIIDLLFALAVVYFLWGIFQFILNQTNEEKKTAGKQHMLWGIIGIVVMMGVYAILHMIMQTFNITGVNPDTGQVQLAPYSPPYSGPGSP